MFTASSYKSASYLYVLDIGKINMTFGFIYNIILTWMCLFSTVFYCTSAHLNQAPTNKKPIRSTWHKFPDLPSVCLSIHSI